MRTITQPKGAALEYAPFILNLYEGCSLACTYCMEPTVTGKGSDFFEKCGERKGILTALERYLDYSIPQKHVLLSYVGDPYQPLEAELRLTRRCLQLLSDRKVPNVAILTKSTLVENDYDLIAKNPGWAIGFSFTSLSDALAVKREPNIACIRDRLAAIDHAEKKGISTFVSVDTYQQGKPLNDLWSLLIFRKLSCGVSFGKLCHLEEDEQIPWHKLLKQVLGFAKEGRRRVCIKSSLADYGDVPEEFRRPLFD